MNKIALMQMTSSTNVEDNLQLVKKFMISAREQGVELIVLPENFSFMGKSEQDKLSIAEVYREGPIQYFISQLAKQLNLWVIAGTISLKTQGPKVKTSCLVFDNEGLTAARYDKIHLFNVQVSAQEVYNEGAIIDRGNELVVVSTPVGKIGLTVCYDLRFPELHQRLVFQGAEIIAVPSAFTRLTGEAHWDVLLRARAIENLAFVLASGQWGQHENGRQTFGHSMAIDPWGRIIAQKQTGIGLVLADIDLSQLKQIRKTFPCLDHHVLLSEN